MDIQELMSKRESAVATAEAMLTASEAEDVEWGDDQDNEFAEATASVKSLSAQIERYKTVADMAASAPDVPRLTNSGVIEPHMVTNVRERLEDDPRRGFNDFGHFASMVATGMSPGVQADVLLAPLNAAVTGMSQGTGSDGGFLVPPEFSQTIWDGMNTASDNLLGRTDGYTITGDSLTFPANAETSRATGSRWGGIRGYWMSEASQFTSSKPTFREVKLEPQELGVFVYVTNKLLRNATALEQWLTRGAIDEINWLVGNAIVNGTGSGQPLGMLKSGSVVSVTKEPTQATKSIVYQNIVNMWARLHPNAQAGAIWLHNVDVFPQLSSMSLDVGTGGIPVFIPAGGLSGAPFATLLGHPLVPSEFCATLGTEGDLILCDMSKYATGTRGGIDSAMSIHLRFDYAESVFRFMFAVDGQPWLASAITPANGTNTLSSHVTLADRV